MAIEFHCPHCQKLLKTPDDKAGVRARCPGCGEEVTVPAAADEHVALAVEAAPEAPAPPPAVAPGEMKACPMCGAQIRAAATRCRYCGENLAFGEHLSAEEAPDGTPTQIDAGDILSRTWKIYQREMGLCIGLFLLPWFLNIVASLPANVVQQMGAVGGIDQNYAMIISTVLFVASYAVNFYLTTGQAIGMLKVARGEPASIGDLFTAGPYYWRAVGAFILFFLMLGAGTLLLCVGAIFVALIFAPFLYVLVDRNVGVLECFTTAKRITTGNLSALLLLMLASIGLAILGVAACLIGILFVSPFLLLLQAVAYLAMSGKRTAERRLPAPVPG